MTVPFKARWTDRARTEYDELREAASAATQNRSHRGQTKASRIEGLFKQVDKCVRLLLQNPRHPGLQAHEYDSIEHPYDKREKVFEAFVQNRTPGAYRLFWCYGPQQGEITIIAITPHP